MPRPLRNIAIIAHVDHGKTTLVDKLLQQAGTFAAHQHLVERVMDSNDIERERGITILAKNTAVDYHGVHINIGDTPGHADFGGEDERVLSMVDGGLLLVDAVEGPMPQTRFVTRKRLAQGPKPILRGTIRKAQQVAILAGDKPMRVAKIGLIHTFQGLDKVETDVASAGEIVSVTGIEDFIIGTTFADPMNPEALATVGVDEPTLTMNFMVNKSPLAGQEGKYVTSRQIRERLDRELL